MTRFAAGLIIGALLSSVTLVSAQVTLGRFTGLGIMGEPRILRMGYALGISDTIQSLASLIREARATSVDASRLHDGILRTADCFQRDGIIVDQFVTFAESKWTQQPMYSAASTLMTRACE
jgi:hypothetical protein